MRAAKFQASLRISAVSPEPPLLAHTSSESRGPARSLAPLNGWACAVKICHDGMLEDTNSLDAVHLMDECCTGDTHARKLHSGRDQVDIMIVFYLISRKLLTRCLRDDLCIRLITMKYDAKTSPGLSHFLVVISVLWTHF